MILRFGRLTALPPWTDECATIVFSLGNSFRSVSLDGIIGAEVLLQPLQPPPNAGIGMVIDRLMQESTHPPVYFVLAHLWMKLFPTEGGLAAIWAARSLPALLGVASIPAMFGLGYLAFRSRLVGQVAAAIMAVSPYGVYLAQDARHYTLAILLVIASLCCLVIAARSIEEQKPLPMGIGLIWVGANSLGIATHYFFTLTLSAQAFVLLGQAWRQRLQKSNALGQPYWRPIYAAAAGTLIGCLVWLPAFQSIQGSEPTSWIYDGNPTVEWLEPLGRVLLWILSMVLLLPSAVTLLPMGIAIFSGLVTFIVVLWAWPNLVQGFKHLQQHADTRLPTQVLGGYILGAIGLCFAFTYGLGMDLTLGARFQFVYFPAVIVLLGAILAQRWSSEHCPQAEQGRISLQMSQIFSHKELLPTKNQHLYPSLVALPKSQLVVISLGLMGLLGSLTVIWNLGYLQNHRPDLLVPIIQKASQAPVLIATTHKHHGQTGRMMGLAWEFKRLSQSQDGETNAPKFFLAHRDSKTKSYQAAIEVFQENLSELPRPLDLWLVDFRTKVDLEAQNCFPDRQYRSSAGEYKYKLYRCIANH
ncbi:MAG TPA: hypothetical protein DDZ80_30790 [Cyanobacteria bacterium UBA8803]|nr:hypothetical protein [Cyanobacteria bacterium UBA9273]HBL62612.1 hypothetical protein [Cyanobacteria bacterium UBA8803]